VLAAVFMVEKVVKISCDWCGHFDESSIKGIGIKTLVKNSEKRGWLTITVAGESVKHYCCEDCLNEYKKESCQSNGS
jgi:hypothetical protein